MSRISNTQALAETIRAQLIRANNSRVAGSAKSKSIASKSKSKDTGVEIAKHMIEHVRSIDRDAPDRRKRAFRSFIEYIITDEFGAAVMNDHRFNVMIENIELRLTARPELTSTIESVLDHLLNGAENISPSPPNN